MWSNEDPRFSVNKRARIIVYTPWGHGCTCLANVNTKDGWFIVFHWPQLTSVYQEPVFDEDQDWPETFFWAWAPEIKKEKV